MVIPADVQRAAESSIIRGPLESGLVGDGRKVLLARTIIASASDADAQDRLSGWQGEFGDENAKVEPRREVWLCLGCNGPI